MHKNRRQLLRGGLVLVLLVQIMYLLVGAFATPVYADADTVQKSAERTILLAFADCINRSGSRSDKNNVVDTHRAYTVATDPIADGADNENKIVGLEVNAIYKLPIENKGALSCLTIITIAAPLISSDTIPPTSDVATQKDNVGAWLFRQLTGKQVGAAKEDMKTKIWEDRLAALSKLATDKANVIGPQTAIAIQATYVPLLNMCYTMYGNDSSAPLKGNDFEEAGVGKFYAKGDRTSILGDTIDSADGNNVLKEATFLSLGGKSNFLGTGHREVFLGKSEGQVLGFNIGGGGGPYDFGSDFYPVGKDIGAAVSDGDGISDCAIIKSNKTVHGAIFGDNQVQIADGKLVFKSTSPNAGNDPIVTNKADSTSPSGPAAATCETSGGAGNLSWIICPIINGTMNAAGSIFSNVVEPFLHTSPITTDPSPGNVVYTVWKSFRTIGNVVLVFALLFVVFGQSIGGGLIDAYTAKKTLPRILVAAIALNLSIYVCALLVDIFNVLGNGMASLITAPLRESKNAVGDGGLSLRPSAGESGVAFLGLIIAAFAGGLVWHLLKKGTAASGGQPGGAGAAIGYLLLFVALPVFLAALAIFITLILRQGIIMALTIISPVALALFAVPAADKYAKKWLDAFIKSLMVYPIITGIFGVSQVLAVTVHEANGGGISTPLVLIAVAIVAFAPLFMIPFAFKLAGGVIGGAAGAIVSGRDKFKKAYGDDKHNPYSFRSRLGHGVREKAGHRIMLGAATDANSFLGKRMGTENQNEAAQGASATTASKDAKKFYDDQTAAAGGTPDPIERNRVMAAATSAAASARKDGYNDEQAQAAAKASANAELSGNYQPEAVAAAGYAAADYLKNNPDATPDEVAEAGRHAADLMANSDPTKIRKDEVMAGAAAAVHARKINPSADTLVASKSGAQALATAKRLGVPQGAARTNFINTAAETAVNVHSSNPGVSLETAATAGNAAAEAEHVALRSHAGTAPPEQVSKAGKAAAAAAAKATIDPGRANNAAEAAAKAAEAYIQGPPPLATGHGTAPTMTREQFAEFVSDRVGRPAPGGPSPT